MIENTALETLLESETDFSTVCEIYHQDATPTADGFDPGDAMGCYAAIAGVSFMGVAYQELIQKIGNVSRTITSKENTASVDFSNVSREISRFELTTGFEGLIMVIRLISRNGSVELSDSMILFAGRCEKPKTGNKTTLSVTANWILGGLDVQIPRRKYTKEDQDGRTQSDPNFEGFIFVPREGVNSYRSKVRRSGILGFFGAKKWVTNTRPWSSASSLDSEKCVPEVWGRSQVMGTHIGYTDMGTEIRFRDAFNEGPILSFENVRSLDPDMPLNMGAYAEMLGDEGAANGPDDPAWVAPGNYSHTAVIRLDVDNSIADVNESAPDVVAVINGRLMTIPTDKGGAWDNPNQWTDNPAAHKRFLLTDEKYFNLDENWIDDADATESYDFDAEQIIDRSLTDFIFGTVS